MKSVLLTGATGYIGQFAIRPLLERGYIVHAVSSNSVEFERTENLIWHRTNLLEADETSSLIKKVCPTHLLHFAWYVEHGKFWISEENRKWVNASLNLLKNFQENSGERVVMSGTCVEYELGKDKFLSENFTPLIPYTLYGQCKLELQQRLAEIGINWAWGRIFFLFGELEQSNRLVASVINSLLKNEFADCSHGNQIRDFLYVKDVADAFVRLLDSDVRGCVNIASGKELTIRECILQIADILGKREKVRFGVIPVSANEPDRIVADVKRLRLEVGWKPDYDFLQAIQETINFWKNMKSI